jgi:RNA polymerase sigma factor (sigma-70 family)
VIESEKDRLTTRWSLIADIRNPEDKERWAEFYDLYRGLIFKIALKAGLREEEAKDVVQETMKSVAKNIQGFEATSARGSFRAWLLQMARWRIEDQRAKRLPIGHGKDDSRETAKTPTIEGVPDILGVDLEQLCDAEWRRAVLKEAFRKLRLQVKAQQFQIYYLLEMEEKSVLEVSRMVGLSRARIYLEKHRVRNKLRKILSQYGEDMS